MLELAVKTLLAYLLGSLMGALLVGRVRGVDIRELGSGNAGGTNALRTQGRAFALAVVVIDVGKGWFAAAVLPGLELPGVQQDPAVSRDWLVVACATAAVLGHVYPVWYEFRGGKGAATLLGVLGGVQPALLLPVVAVWFAVVVLTGYVGLATMLATAAFPVAQLLRDIGALPLVAFGIATTAFVVYTHRSNIARMRAGTENRARRLWLFGRHSASS
ncbi:MAG: glycerol-3-phosphate 1-O-acyltransferase PlsY [Steroidobacteraceae bacterium]|jgi:glycerol-3-phosphate acyltransferase PlsY|nr:glycerol-3-phosphate 1-O-acyltransferase PlsY [Steroidobacteraceae bacterium]